MSKRCTSPESSSRKRGKSSRRAETDTINVSDDDQCSSGSADNREECDVIVIDETDAEERKSSDKSSSRHEEKSHSSKRSEKGRRVGLTFCGSRRGDDKKKKGNESTSNSNSNAKTGNHGKFKSSKSSSPPLVDLDQEKKQLTLDTFVKTSRDKPTRQDKENVSEISGDTLTAAHLDDVENGLVDKISDLIDQICSLLSPHLEQSEMKVIAKVKKYYTRTMDAVNKSPNGLDQVEKACTKCRLNIETKPERCFTVVRAFLEQLESIRMAMMSNATRSSLPDDKPEVKPSASKSVESNSESRPGHTGKRILKLEKTLRRLEREINRFELLEVDWDDDACSSYAIAARLKKRYVQVYYLYCELINAQDQADRVKSKRKVNFEGTRFPEVNARIEKFVNRTGCFPDYSDVLQEVCDANERHSLHMSHQVQEQVAEQAFRVLGAQLQRNRRAALLETMDCLAGAEDWRKKDPAINNVQLREKLLDNADRAEKSINDVLEHYTRLQQERLTDGGDVEEDVADDSYDESEVTDDDVDPLSTASPKNCGEQDKSGDCEPEEVRSSNGVDHVDNKDQTDEVVDDKEDVDIGNSSNSKTNEEFDST